ncbi:MAG: hypothetical protein K6G79_03340 [Bacteroidales bacterium]|nr:hypothetical protein [Bacteroidales bacterium]
MEKKTKRRFDWGSFFVTALGTAIGVALTFIVSGILERRSKAQAQRLTAIMVPIEDGPGFYDVMGRNTDYICVPEECLADNFSFLISYGFFGRYDLTLDTRKVLFVPYITPTLIRNIHATLLEHFPGR